MTLRRVVLLVGGLSIVVGALLALFAGGTARGIGVYVLAEGVVCLLFVLLERSRYRPRAKRPGALRATGERMVDPTSGRLLEVWEDPATGEREYRPARQG